MLVQPGLDEDALLLEVADDLLRRLGRREPVQPAEAVVEAPRLVDRLHDLEPVHLRELEVLVSAAGRDVDDARALVERDLVPRNDAMLDLGDVVERAAVRPADELRPRPPFLECLVRVAADRDPLPVRAAAVLRLRVDRGRDVGRERPRRRRPDDEVLAGAIEQREADVERRVGAIDVGADQLVLGDRRAAARAPLGRAVPHVEPVPLVDALQHPPDVLDVRVAEGEVVLAPVHPLPEPDRAAGQRLGRPHDDVAAAARELLEAELLDLALRVEPELALDADLDPEPLRVEAVLVALVEAAQRLVPLEDVLQRPAPGRVDAEREPVRGDRAVDEGEGRAALVLLAQLRERALGLPAREHLLLEPGMIGFVR